MSGPQVCDPPKRLKHIMNTYIKSIDASCQM